ncbi:heparan-alpha-glucosaminide N-acetyltransferase domain-containing protein [Nocardioides dongxiaopingii]|uniref:heparan-alpha-glucosaminide N-acetyltransferase domain-containing protein n=1 Tax=Nocardioides dongxiaopingii TaxID=2576036 RepID=UPI0010C76220|nr:heparan-alpha-glucosaminide N-acetyltransferase domain-containing protein [Nocardioides dongxiaopingii]
MAGASASSPTHPGARLVGIDVARCVALLGMVATHVLDARTPAGDVAASQWLAGGRASALFAVLAGVSLALVTGRRTPFAGRRRLRATRAVVVRAVLVGLVGLLLGELDTGLAVILTYYAVLFVLALPFLGLRARPLLVLAVGWAVLAPVVSHLVRPGLPDRGTASPALDQLAEPGRLLSELLLTGYYPAVPWLAYLLLGLALGRLDLGSARVAARLVGVGLAVAVGATLLSGLLTRDRFGAAELDRVATGMYGQTPTDDGWRWLLVVAPHSTTPFDLLQTGGSAAVVVGLCLLLVAAVSAVAGPGERAVQVLCGAGTMTLTLYSLHVVMRTDAVWPAEEPDSLVWHVLVLAWVGALYAALDRSGPLERVVALASRRAGGGTTGRG